jgi:hypothetical protein
MNKIPVFATIGGAYRFAFGRFVGNLGVVWAPVILLMAAGWFILPHIMNAYSGSLGHMLADHKNPIIAIRGMMQAYRILLLYGIVALLLRAQMMLGLTRRAFGTATGPSFVFLSLGKTFWRVAGAFFAVTIIMVAAEFALAIVGGIIALLAGLLANLANGGGKEAIGLVFMSSTGIMIAVAACGLFYVFVRLTFFLTAAVVDTERFDLLKPWRLAGGNFWRIVVVGIVIFVPAAILVSAISMLVMVWAMKPFMTGLPAMHAHDPQAVAAIMRHLAEGLNGVLLGHWYVFVPFTLVNAALIYSLATGASVTAYRALVPKVEPEPAA